MPKAKRKSLGRQFKGSNANQTQIPSQGPDETPSQQNVNIAERPITPDVEMENLDNSNLQEMEWIDSTAIRMNENSSIVVDIQFSSGADIQPGPSGL